MINEESISKLGGWFNGLDYHLRKNIFDFIKNDSGELAKMGDGDIDNFKSLVNEVVQFIVSAPHNKDVVIERLCQGGFDDMSAEAFYEFCKAASRPQKDAIVVRKMGVSQLNDIIEFIIDNIILYKNYKFIPFEEFVSIGHFSSREEAQGALRFLKNFILQVCARELSPSLVVKILVDQFNMSKDACDVVASSLEKKRDELHQAFLLSKINDLLSLLSTKSIRQRKAKT